MSQLGVFDLFRLGVGPSSSHTVGPMRAGRAFGVELEGISQQPVVINVDLYGSLAATGIGHGTDRAVLLGLGGADPETVEIERVDQFFPSLTTTGVLPLSSGQSVPFDLPTNLRFHADQTLGYHVNALRIEALFDDAPPLTRTYYSIGGGFVMEQVGDEDPQPLPADVLDMHGEFEGAPKPSPYPFKSGAQMLAQCSKAGLSIAAAALENELVRHSHKQVSAHLDKVMGAMFGAVKEGCEAGGILPGGLRVPRRAKALRERLESSAGDALAPLDWVNLYALAVNEENAAGHRVVTAPTNGAAGVIPAVLGHFIVMRAAEEVGGIESLAARVRLWELDTVLEHFPHLRSAAHDFLLAAAAVGSLIKMNASFAGAEVGCQGEVGSASAMAAAGLAQALGGSVEQVENAAEIAMEHSLGLTCDPVGGLVQIPCIERNAIAAVKAISAARMALYGDGRHRVPLDVAIETMRQTGLDMHSKYKETSVGGLAVNVVEC